MATGSGKARIPDGAVRYRRRMPDVSLTEPGHGGAPGNSHQKRPTLFRWWGSPRFIALTALAIALIAVAVAIAAWFLPARNHFSGQQSAQAKTKVCSTYTTVKRSVSEGTPNPRPDDPVSQTAVAANVRLAMIGGSSYLKETLAAEPATPADLTKAVKSMADTLDQLGFDYLLMQDATVIQPLLETFNSELAQIDPMCAGTKDVSVIG